MVGTPRAGRRRCSWPLSVTRSRALALLPPRVRGTTVEMLAQLPRPGNTQPNVSRADRTRRNWRRNPSYYGFVRVLANEEPVPSERVLTMDLALLLTQDAGRPRVIAGARPHPVIAGAGADGALVVIARPPWHPVADMRVCDTCGGSLAGKKRHARYCDGCVSISRKVATTRRLRRTKRWATPVQPDKVEKAVRAFVKQVKEAARDRTSPDVAWSLPTAADVMPGLDRRSDDAERTTREEAAFVDMLETPYAAKDDDVLNKNPADLSEEAYQERDEEVQESDERASLHAAFPDGPSHDLLWCHRNQAAGVLTPMLGYVRRTHASSGRSGKPRLRHSEIDKDGRVRPATREEVWKENRRPQRPALPAAFFGWAEEALIRAHGEQVTGVPWESNR